MLKVLNCVVYHHDLRLVALAAIICGFGCFTTATLIARVDVGAKLPALWLSSAALVFGCSVWSLHFVAMLGFNAGSPVAFAYGPTALSIAVAAGGALAAFFAWQAPLRSSLRVTVGGLLLGLAIAGMHYIGVAAMKLSGLILLNRSMVAWSLAVSIGFSTLALARASGLNATMRGLEIAGWLSLAVCGLHFTGMAAITIVPSAGEMPEGTFPGTSTLAFAVGIVSIAILLAALTATMLDQHLSQRTLRELARMRLLSNLAKEVLIIQRDGIVLEVNDAGARLFKTTADEIIGKPLLDFFPTDSAPALLRRERCAPQDRRPEEYVVQTINGTHVSVELSCQPIDYLGRPATAVALQDLTDRKRDEQRIRHLARHDALTDLPNRYSLQERLDLALDAAAQARGRLAVIYLDLDRFKAVNDLHGHAVGDQLLMQVAKRMLAELQSVDTLARIGGDEFVMVFSRSSQPEKASAVAKRVIEALRRPFQIEGKRIEIGASAGVAFYPDDGGNADALLRAADVALYRAKENGRGGLRFYEAAMNAQLQVQLQMEQELACAIERGELVLHYQPVVNGTTGEVETFEALIRWAHPTRGLVPPATFIPLAERTGLIVPIGRWVIETACRDAASWPRPWRVSVNVSPAQFRHGEVCDVIRRALDANAFVPARLVVEVTEGVLIDDASQAVATLTRLRELGVRIALDDFGTGYSSLSYLQLFKFDKLKIDRSFVSRLGDSKDALTLTRTIVNLGHNLGLQVTAEGVETVAQLAVLRKLGCDQIQGYLVARPAPFKAPSDVDRVRTAALFNQDRLFLTA